MTTTTISTAYPPATSTTATSMAIGRMAAKSENTIPPLSAASTARAEHYERQTEKDLVDGTPSD